MAKCLRCSFEELHTARETLSIKECASKFRVSRATICHWLKFYNLSKDRKIINQDLTDEQLEIIDGSLLGDGYLDNRGKYNSRFNKVQCLEHEPYLKWTFDKLEPFSLNIIDQWTAVIERVDDEIIDTGEEKLQKKYYTVTHPIFTKLREKWYINGVKTIPDDINLTPLGITIWFMDDGSAEHHKRDARFHTDGFTPSDIDKLIFSLKKFDIKASAWKHYDKFDIGVSGQNYIKLMELIKPFVFWECFKRKIN